MEGWHQAAAARLVSAQAGVLPTGLEGWIERAQGGLLPALAHRDRAALEPVERALGHRFAHPALLSVALTQASWVNERVQGDPSLLSDPPMHNATLEFLGDAVVGMVTAAWLWRTHAGADEGELTQRRLRLVRRETLAALAQRLGLMRLLATGRGDAHAATHLKTQCDVAEALLAALWCDARLAGLDALSVCERALQPLWALDPAEVTLDAISEVVSRAQAVTGEPPLFEVVQGAEPGDPSSVAIVQVVLVRGDRRVAVAQGRGASKKLARRDAAAQALTADLAALWRLPTGS